MSVIKSLSDARHRVRTLVVHSKGSESSRLRQVLMGCGFDSISTASSYVTSLLKAKEESSEFVLFEAVAPDGSEIDTLQFLDYFKKLRKNAVLVACTSEPDGEYLFKLLQAGARAYLMSPITSTTIEEMLRDIVDGRSLSEKVLMAKDRNRAFAEQIAQQIERAGSVLRSEESGYSSEKYRNELERLNQAVKVSRFFCEGGEDSLFNVIHEMFYEKAVLADKEFEQSRLRLTRERLRAKRGHS